MPLPCGEPSVHLCLCRSTHKFELSHGRPVWSTATPRLDLNTRPVPCSARGIAPLPPPPIATVAALLATASRPAVGSGSGTESEGVIAAAAGTAGGATPGRHPTPAPSAGGTKSASLATASRCRLSSRARQAAGTRGFQTALAPAASAAESGGATMRGPGPLQAAGVRSSVLPSTLHLPLGPLPALGFWNPRVALARRDAVQQCR